MESNAKNYHEDGGRKWVIGGTLTFLPGATVEGAEGLFDIAPGGEVSLPYMADTEATTVAGLRDSFNQLLGMLRTSGLMKQASVPVISGGTVVEELPVAGLDGEVMV